MKLLIFLVAVFSSVCSASITENGRGMLFGEGHAFAVTATQGWVLDNESGKSQGLHMLFYPKGYNWSNSPVFVYGRSIEAKSIEEQVEFTINDFRINGSPEYTAIIDKALELPAGKVGELYYYSGDQWGNHEAAVYFLEGNTINFLVFSSRTKGDFEKYIKAFKETALTYKNLYEAPSGKSQSQFDILLKESVTDLERAGAKKYESTVVEITGESISAAIMDCASYLSDTDLHKFHYLVKINNNGKMGQSVISPTTTLSTCFSGLMNGVRYPQHNFGRFVFSLKMNVKP